MNEVRTTLILTASGRNLRVGAHMARAVTRAYNGGLARSPQRSPGAAPLVRSPLKLNALRFWTSNESGRICCIDCFCHGAYVMSNSLLIKQA